MIDQKTPDPWEDVELCVRNPYIDAEEAWRVVDAALAAERATTQIAFDGLKAAEALAAKLYRDEQEKVAERDETIRQLQDAFARCQEVQQATAETWRIEHDQMAEQIATLQGAVAADEERLRQAAARAGVLFVGCDTADALADRCATLTAAMGGR